MKTRLLGAQPMANLSLASSAPAPLSPSQRTLIIRSFGKRLAAVKVLKKLEKGLSTQDALALIKSTPSLWMSGLSEGGARQMQQELALKDVVVTIETDPDVISQAVSIQRHPAFPKSKLVVGLALVAILIALIVASVSRPATSSHASATAPAPTDDVKTVSASRLYRDYERNEVAADSLYKGKKLLVNGTVQIDKDFTDSPYLTLVTTNMFLGIHAGLREGQLNRAADLSKGQAVSLLCVGRGKLVSSPILEDCVLQ